jgi:hypothetical protein
MTEKSITNTAPTADTFKKRAVRFAKLNQLQETEKQTPQTPDTKARYKCLSCLWHYECDNVCAGGCEEYEA